MPCRLACGSDTARRPHVANRQRKPQTNAFEATSSVALTNERRNPELPDNCPAFVASALLVTVFDVLQMLAIDRLNWVDLAGSVSHRSNVRPSSPLVADYRLDLSPSRRERPSSDRRCSLLSVPTANG